MRILNLAPIIIKLMNLYFICGHHVSLAFYSFYLHTYNLVLDSCIAYEALKDEFAQDASLLDQLEDAKTSLRSYFNDKYMAKSQTQISSGPAHLSSTPSSSLLSVTSQSSTTTSLAHTNGSPQKNFTARFQRKHVATDELSEFWNLSQEYFEKCNPVQWWYQQRAQFPNLYCLARDILSIPGIVIYQFSLSAHLCRAPILLRFLLRFSLLCHPSYSYLNPILSFTL